MSIVLVGVLGYIVVQFGIGIAVSRGIRTEDDYLIAGRSLGYGLTTFTVFATWFGAETCVGAAGAIYERGLSGGSADPFGYGVCLLLLGAVFAVPLWKRKLTTIGDLFRERFSGQVERLAVILIVPTSLFWAAAQVRAFGQVLAASSGLEVWITITLAATFVVIYTLFGGLLADAWTDLVQGIAIAIGLVILFWVVVNDVGLGPLRAVEPSKLVLFDASSGWMAVIEDWSIPLCGSVLAAELVARVIAARSPEVARRSTLMAGGFYLSLGLIPVTLGLMGAQLVPGLADPEQVIPAIAQQYLPPILYAVFAGALISAILSTVDSALLVASSLVSHNVIVPLIPEISERAKVWTARGGVACLGLLAYVMALYADGVYKLVEQASAFGSAGTFVVLVFGLFTPMGGPRTALATLIAGVTVWIAGAYLLDVPFPYITSLSAALITYLLGSIVEDRLMPALAPARTRP